MWCVYKSLGRINLKKKLIIIILLIILILVGHFYYLRYYVSINHNIIYSEDLDRKDLDLVISDYIKNNYLDWGNISTTSKTENHTTYGIDKMFGLKYVYINTSFNVYHDTVVSGGSNPLVIIVKEDSSGMYTVINHKEPVDGDSYESSMKRIFPHKYLVKIPYFKKD